MMPLVSVIIPAFNAEKYLAEAITSVLTQEYHNFEVLLVDDGSTDNTKKIAQSFPVKVLTKEHGGIGVARNFGIKESSGELIAFLDSDDIWLTGKLKLQVSMLSKEYDIVFGKMENFVSPEVSEIEKDLSFPKGLQPGFHPGAMLARREIFETVGLFREDLKVGEFVDWFSRARDRETNCLMLEELVLRRRIHLSNTTRVVKDLTSDYLKIALSKIKKNQ